MNMVYYECLENIFENGNTVPHENVNKYPKTKHTKIAKITEI